MYTIVPHEHFDFCGNFCARTTPTLALSPSLWSSCVSFTHPLFSLLPAALLLPSPVSVAALEPGRRLKSEGLNLIKYSADIDFSESLDSPLLTQQLSVLSLTCALLAAVTNKSCAPCTHIYTLAQTQPRTYAHGES